MDKGILTAEEQALVKNAGWIYLKNGILEKAMVLLGELQSALEGEAVIKEFPAPGDGRGKLTRGERYKELPYIILDYPRYFSHEHIFAFRTMFWWGHYFIGTLHLSGELKDKYVHALLQGRSVLAESGFQLYVREDDPWHHDLENGNYRLISAMPVKEFEQLVNRLPFIKIAKSYPLDGWEKLIPGVVTDYVLLLELLGSDQ